MIRPFILTISLLLPALAAVSSFGAGPSTASPISEFIRFRDPFRQPDIKKEEAVALSELERYSATEFKVLGVVTGPLHKRAMIQSPDNKTYTVAEGMRIGQRGGQIRRITTRSVIIREEIVNALGEKEDLDTELPIATNTEGARNRG